MRARRGGRLKNTRRDAAELLLLLAIVGFSIWTRMSKLTVYATEDDGAYVAACGLIMRGYRPYVDFFLAHPPLYFWIVVWLWRLLGLTDPYWMWLVSKSVSLASFLGVTAIVYLSGRRIGGWWAGVFGAALYQLSVYSYTYSVSCTPQLFASLLMMAVFILLIGDRARSPGRLFSAGLILGLAVITRLSALFIVPVYGIHLLHDAGGRSELRRKLLLTSVGFVIPLLFLVNIPMEELWHSIVLFHFLKGSVSPEAGVLKFFDLIMNKEIPILLGILSIPYLMWERDWRPRLAAASGCALLCPYFLQPPGGHMLLEAVPFLTILASVTVAGCFKTSHNPDNLTVRMAVAAVIVGLLGINIPASLSSLSHAVNETPYEGKAIPKLIRLTEEYTAPDDSVFSQLPIVPFLAQRPYPPLIDTSQTAKAAGIYTPQVVKELIVEYDVKLLIVWFRTGEEIRDFLAGEGFTKVANVQGYYVYLNES